MVLVYADGGFWAEVKPLPADTVEPVVAARANQALRYCVAATSGNGRLALSNAVEIDTRPITLQAPKLVEVTGGYKWLDLKWDDTNVGEAGHLVEHSTDGRMFTAATRIYGDGRIRAHLYVPRTQTNYVRAAAFGFDGRPGPWSPVGRTP